MVCLVLTYHQVFISVVVINFIVVVDDSFWWQGLPERLLCYQNMLKLSVGKCGVSAIVYICFLLIPRQSPVVAMDKAL